MAFTVTDPALLAAIQKAHDSLEFLDAEGKLLGRLTLELASPIPPWMSKFPQRTPEELAALRTDPTLRPMREVIEEIKARVEAKLWPTK